MPGLADLKLELLDPRPDLIGSVRVLHRDVWCAGQHGDSGGDGGPRHLERRLGGRRPVVETGQQVVVEIDHR